MVLEADLVFETLEIDFILTQLIPQEDLIKFVCCESLKSYVVRFVVFPEYTTVVLHMLHHRLILIHCLVTFIHV